MKNITKQYQDLLEGKMSKDNFVKSVRRDFPQWISPVNSFNDAISILKSKRILTESPDNREIWRDAFEAAIHNMDLSDESKRVVIDALDHVDPMRDYGDMSPNEAAYDFAQDVIGAYDEDMLAQMQANQGVNLNYPGNDSILEDEEEKKRGGIDLSPEATRKMIDRLNKQKPRKEVEPEDSEDEMERGDFDDIMRQGLNEAVEKPEGKYKEATGKAEYDKFAEMDRVNYRQLMKGMEYELLKMPEITDENLIKAKKKAYQNLIKNPKAYLDLLVKNEKEIEKRDKDLRMQPVKGDNKVDKPNAMKVIKKDEGSNTQTNLSNRERAKGMPEGVKVMKESFVEQLRNYILSEMVEVGSPKTSFNVGEMVKTPKGEVGTVESVSPDNITEIKLESGAVVEYQGNVLKAHEAELKMQEDSQSNIKWPDLKGKWNGMSPDEKLNSLKQNKFLGKQPEETLKALANLSFDELYNYDTPARKQYGIAPYAALLQGFTFPSKVQEEDKHTALKEKLMKGLKKEITRLSYKGANEYVKDSDVNQKKQQIVAAGGSAGDVKTQKI